MRQLFVLISLVVLPLSACATIKLGANVGDNLSSDNYRPFAQTGKTWETRVGWTEENVYCNRIDGDTLINGESWKKVYNFYAFPELNYSYYAAIRDVGKKVYAIAKGSSRPRLLYDFGLKVGDIVRCGVEGTAFGCLLDEGEQLDSLLGFRLFYYLRLERIDTVESCGLKHPRFTLTMLDPFKDKLMMADDIVWVEGIGSGAGAALSTVSFSVGGAIGGALTGFTSGAASGSILGGGNSILQHGNFSHFWDDAFSQAKTGAISGVIIGGVFGGVSAHYKENNILTGKPIVSNEVQWTPRIKNDVIPNTDNLNYSSSQVPESFFDNTEYTQKVIKQMNSTKEDFHTFPKSVDAFENSGKLLGLLEVMALNVYN